jgi:hypothetical protein
MDSSSLQGLRGRNEIGCFVVFLFLHLRCAGNPSSFYFAPSLLLVAGWLAGGGVPLYIL